MFDVLYLIEILQRTLEFRVQMTCEGCSGAVKRVLDKHKGKTLAINVSIENNVSFLQILVLKMSILTLKIKV